MKWRLFFWWLGDLLRFRRSRSVLVDYHHDVAGEEPPLGRCPWCHSLPCYRGDSNTCPYRHFRCVTCRQFIDKAETQWVGVGTSGMDDSAECMPCHTERTGETYEDVIERLLRLIAADEELTLEVRLWAADHLRQPNH